MLPQWLLILSLAWEGTSLTVGDGVTVISPGGWNSKQHTHHRLGEAEGGIHLQQKAGSVACSWLRPFSVVFCQVIPS